MQSYQIRIEAIKLAGKLASPLRVLVQVIALENCEGQRVAYQTSAILLESNETTIEQDLKISFSSRQISINNQFRFRVLSIANSQYKQFYASTPSFLSAVSTPPQLKLLDKDNQQVGTIIVKFLEGIMQINQTDKQIKKSRKNSLDFMQNKISVIELEIYEKDVIINNLTLELKVKSEEAKYLFTSERVKQLTGQLQQENRELKQRIAALEKELSSRDIISISSSNRIVSSSQQFIGIQAKLVALINLMSHVLNVGPIQNRGSDLQSSSLEGVRRLVIRTEKMVSMIHKAYLDLKSENSQQLGKILDLQNELSKFQNEISDKKSQMDLLKEQTVQLIKQIKKYTVLVNQKEQETQKTKIRLSETLTECQKLSENVEDAKLQCQRLRLEIQDAHRIIANLRRDNCQLNKLMAVRGQFSLDYKSQAEVLAHQLSKAQGQITKFEQQCIKLTKQRDECRNDLRELQFQLEQLKIMMSSSQPESFDRLLDIGGVRKEDIMTARYEKRIEQLKERVQQLEQIEKYTVALSNSLGYRSNSQSFPLKKPH